MFIGSEPRAAKFTMERSVTVVPAEVAPKALAELAVMTDVGPPEIEVAPVKLLLPLKRTGPESDSPPAPEMTPLRLIAEPVALTTSSDETSVIGAEMVWLTVGG